LRVAVACAVLVVAFVAALMIGRSGGGSEEKIDTPASVKAIELPEGSTQVPKLVSAGNVPELRKTPEAATTSATGTSGSSPTTTSSPSTGSTPSSGGGGGSTGGGSEPTAPPPG
jgi:uncharacterized membrane protein YgcG